MQNEVNFTVKFEEGVTSFLECKHLYTNGKFEHSKHKLQAYLHV